MSSYRMKTYFTRSFQFSVSILTNILACFLQHLLKIRMILSPVKHKQTKHNNKFICGIIYRQHNSPGQFIEYFNDTIEKLASTGKMLYLMGDFNLCLLKTESSSYSQDFLLALQSFYLLPTIDKPTRVRNNSASLIDNIFVNNPDQVLISGKIITDVSDHFS